MHKDKAMKALNYFSCFVVPYFFMGLFVLGRWAADDADHQAGGGHVQVQAGEQGDWGREHEELRHQIQGKDPSSCLESFSTSRYAKFFQHSFLFLTFR